MSQLDLSRMTPPQIAQAVVAGECAVEEATAELRRRPSEPGRRPPPRRLPPPPVSSEAALAAALVETQKELREATRKLGQLARRIEHLAAEVEKHEQARARRPKRAASLQTRLLVDDEAA